MTAHSTEQSIDAFVESERHRIPLTRQQACVLMGIKMTTLNKLIQTNELPSIRVGRRRFISRTAIDAFMQTHSTTTPR